MRPPGRTGGGSDPPPRATLLLRGEQDARSPLAVARQFEQAIPDAKLVVIPGAGHLSNLERPDEFNQAYASSVAWRDRESGDGPADA